MKEIKTTTIYNEKLIKDFLNIYFIEKTRKFKILLNLLLIIMIIYFFTNKSKTIFDYITYIIALFGIIEINTSMIPRLNFYRTKRKKNSIINRKINYIFKKRNFTIINEKEEYIDYDLLYKVVETDNYYYLYVNKYRTLIVDKSNIKDSDIEDLSDRLKKEVSTYIDNVRKN